MAHIERLLAQRPLASAVLDELIGHLPDKVWLTEIAYGAGKVRIKGRAPSNDLLVGYLTRLDKNPTLVNLRLGASVSKTAQGRESVEFALEADPVEGQAAPASEGAAPDARLAELERTLLPRPEPAASLREIQRLVLDAGLQMTKFTPGTEAAAEFTGELPVTIEVAGAIRSTGRFFRGLAAAPLIWVVERFSLKTVTANDPRSPARVSITARAYFAL